MLLALPALYGYALIMTAVGMLLPSRIQVRKARIHATTGQSHLIVDAASVQRTRIVVFASNRIRLRVTYLEKEQIRSRTFGVGQGVGLDALSQALPVRPTVCDA